MNLASNTAPVPSTIPSRVARHPAIHRVPHLPLHVRDHLAGIALVPVPIEVLGHGPELDDQVAREVLRLDLAALLAPEPEQGGLVIAHDDPGVRAADEGATVGSTPCGCRSHKIFPSSICSYVAEAIAIDGA